MNEQNKIFAKLLFGKQSSGGCYRCGSMNVMSEDFSDDISRREHAISGLCQQCQDCCFAPENEEDE